MLSRVLLALLTIALSGFIALLVFVRVFFFPGFFAQPDATGYVLRLLLLLVVYVGVSFWVATKSVLLGTYALRTILSVGAVGGLAEVLNVSMENGLPIPMPSRFVPLAITLIIFLSWGLTGYLVTRRERFKVGFGAAVVCGIFCMLLGVAGGIAFELYIVPVHPDVVATWAEFQRSGWSNPAAFQVANTLDSAFTHLLVSPVVALLVGGLGATLGKL